MRAPCRSEVELVAKDRLWDVARVREIGGMELAINGPELR
jgi:hypothetical protein